VCFRRWRGQAWVGPRPRRAERQRAPASPLGIAVLPRRDELISNEHVNRLRDELGI
jgi:hypothetical protein